MLVLLMIIIYIFLNIYVLNRYWTWLKIVYPKIKNIKIFWGIGFMHMLIASSIVIAYFAHNSLTKRIVTQFSTGWMCGFIYFLLFIAVVDGIRLVLKYVFKSSEAFRTHKTILTLGLILVLGGSIGLCGYGVNHAREMKDTYYSIQVNKHCKNINNMNIVLVADMHLGYSFGATDMEKMTQHINKMNADLVCFAGDIFDNNFDDLDNSVRIKKAFQNIKSTYGVYACFGNHDVDERLLSGFSVTPMKRAVRDNRMETFLKESNINILDDKAILIADSFYLIGRKDYEKPGDGTLNRATMKQLLINLDMSKPILVMDHEPRFLDEKSELGVDIDLGGHTHNGQFFPLNLITPLIWQNPTGCVKVKNMYSVVTSGIGVYGPDMRVMTDSEVVQIKVKFKD